LKNRRRRRKKKRHAANSNSEGNNGCRLSDEATTADSEGKEAHVLAGEVVEQDGERAEGEEHVDLGLEDDDTRAGERPPTPAARRERLRHGRQRADVLEVQRLHHPRGHRRSPRRRRQLHILLVCLHPQAELLRTHHRHGSTDGNAEPEAAFLPFSLSLL
jgi:hypothetical protein